VATKQEFLDAREAYDKEVSRLREIILPLAERMNSTDLQDPQLPSKIDALKKEYADFRIQVNPPDAKVKELDKEMCRLANELKETQETDDGKIAINKLVLSSQSVGTKSLIPIAVNFKDAQKIREDYIKSNPEKYGGGDAAASSSTQEATRVQAESSKTTTNPTSAIDKYRITNPNEAIAAAGAEAESSFQALSNVKAGAASIITGLSTTASAMTDIAKQQYNNAGDDTYTGILKKYGLTKSNASGPPYDNILHQFASYSPIWTMAALEPNQFNDPRSYRGKPAALKHVVFSSGGRFDKDRVQVFGAGSAPEYFVNNFEFITTCGASPQVGNSNVQTIAFDLYEPYSMGYFLQSLQAAAINAGYTTYNECPFVLKLEFVGHKQDGSIYSSTDLLTRYFCIQLQSADFTVSEGGSNYKVKGHPWNQNAWSNTSNFAPNEVKMTGLTVQEMLSSGPNSLMKALNVVQRNAVDAKQQELPDEFVVVFPVNWADPVGLNTDSQYNDGSGSATVAVNDETGETYTPLPIPSISTEDFGWGTIGYSEMGFDSTSGGNYNFGLAGDVVDPATGVITRDSLTIDPKQRTFSFPAQTQIHQIIAQVVLSSNYAKEAIKAENLNAPGMISWFRIDAQIQLGQFDTKRGVRARKYIYRVMPYYVHNSVFSNPTAAPPGYDKLKEVLAKEYNYIYTGQNIDVIKFDITINSLFHTMKAITPPKQGDSIVNPDTQTPSEDPPEDIESGSGGATDAIVSFSAAPSKPNAGATKKGVKAGYGAEDIAKKVAVQMNNAIAQNGSTAGDLMKISIEIVGDPYYMVDQGIANYTGDVALPGGPDAQITSDQTMNYQGTDSYFNIVFRTPIEPNLGVSSGLYRFPNAGAESPYSGIYKIIKVTNKFSDGAFRQVLEANRMPKQPSDFPDGYKPEWKNPLAYGGIKEGQTKTSVVQDSGNGIELRTPEEIQASDDLNDFYG
jgi:hypothetical protein